MHYKWTLSSIVEVYEIHWSVPKKSRIFYECSNRSSEKSVCILEYLNAIQYIIQQRKTTQVNLQKNM